MTKTKQAILLFFLFVYVARGVAALEIKNSRLGSASLVAGSQIQVFDEKYLLTPGWWQQFSYMAHENFIRFGLDETQHALYSGSFRSMITYNVKGYDKFGMLVYTSSNNTLDLNYTASGVYSDKAIQRLPGGYPKIIIDVTAIVTVNASNVTISNPGQLYLEGEVQTTRYYPFNSTTPSIAPADLGYNLITRPCPGTPCVTDLEIYWDYMPGAEEYELEWTWINDYSGANLFYDFRHDATRITTSQQSYRIPILYEKGYIAFRLRGIGRNGPHPLNDRVESYWTSGASNMDYGSLGNYPANLKYQINTATSNTSDGLNWSATMTFAEDGKKGAGLSYMDGMLMNRQSQAKLNTDAKVIAGQTYYDFQGRPAVSVLPAPVGRNYFHYEPTLNVSLNSGQPYSKLDFDADTVSCASKSWAMDKALSLGAANYYSPSNPNQAGAQGYVPDAHEYPFTQIEYMPDQTGRPRAQTMPGRAHLLGWDHEVRYFYSNPSQAELSRLFGSEAGKAGHYDKVQVADPNGQISVSYKDMQGRVVATALAGDRPAGLDSVAGHNNAGLLLDNMLEFNRTDKTDYKIVSSKNIFVESAGSVQTFQYEFTPEDFTDACSPKCFDCIYEVEFSIKDACGEEVSKTGYPAGQSIKATVGAAISPTNIGTCDSPVVKFELSPSPVSVTFPKKGSYTVTKTLRVSDAPVNEYIAEFLDGNTCTKSLQDFLQDEINAIDFSSCGIDCQACSTSVASYVTNNPGALTPQQISDMYANCAELCPPNDPCEAARRAMLSDFMPGGQYAAYTESGGSYSSSDPTSIFHASSATKKYTTITYPVSAYIKINGVSTDPATLSTGDFIKYYKKEWAELFLAFHPEYVYYEFCILNSISDKYDREMLEATSFDEACAKGFLKPLAFISPAYTYPTSCLNSCTTTANYDPFFYAGGQGTTANYIVTNHGFSDAYGNTTTHAGTTYNYTDFMEYAFRNVYPLPNGPPAVQADIYNLAAQQSGNSGQFGCDPCLKDQEWILFRNLYLTYKFRLVHQRRTDYVMLRNSSAVASSISGFNGCMVNSGLNSSASPYVPGVSNPVASNMAGALVLPGGGLPPVSLNFLPFIFSPDPVVVYPAGQYYTQMCYPVSNASTTLYDAYGSGMVGAGSGCIGSANYYNPWGGQACNLAGISGDPRQPCSMGNTTLFNSKIARFPQLPFSISSLINNYNSSSPPANNIFPAVSSLVPPPPSGSVSANYCHDLCASYADEWLFKLAACVSSLSSTQLNDLRDDLIEVCADGCDISNPLGSSSINPAAPNPAYSNFEQVLTAHLGSATPDCSADLLALPKPYGSSIANSILNPVTLDTCGCNKILRAKYLFLQNIASLPAGVTTPDQYFKYLYGELPADFSGLECDCETPWTGVGAGTPLANWYNGIQVANWTAPQQAALQSGAPRYVPAYLACPKACLPCSTVVNAITAYQSAHPAFIVSDNYPTLLSNHLNHLFDFDLGFDDYIAFYEQCTNNTPAPCGMQIPIASKLKDLLNEWIVLYNNSLPAGPFSPPVVFGAGPSLPALPSLFNSPGTPDFLTCPSPTVVANSSGDCNDIVDPNFGDADALRFINLLDGPNGLGCNDCELYLDGLSLPSIGNSQLMPPVLPEVTGIYFTSSVIVIPPYTYNFKYTLDLPSGVVTRPGYFSCLPVLTPCNYMLCNKVVDAPPLDNCADLLLNNAYNNAVALYEEQNRAVADNFTRRYKEKCIQLSDELFDRSYSLREYHYTLYYYDQAGNLVRTVPPKGVALLAPASYNTVPAHQYVSTYTHQSYNAPLNSQSPDETANTEYVYDALGRIVASANARQKAAGAYSSYTLYDAFGRITEVGEVNAGISVLRSAAASNTHAAAINGATKKQIIHSYYDAPLSPYIESLFPGGLQDHLRKRVSSVTYEDQDDGNDLTYNYATHYSYDDHGNLKQLVQENKALTGLARDYFTLEYDYDLVSGNMNRVSYQKGRQDAFFHQYEYDADNRLHTVYTSKDGHTWDRDAKYFYYEHGPLARKELGDQKVHAEDYAYTIQGWIKAVNSNALEGPADPGKDGIGSGYSSGTGDIHKFFGRDAAGYSLNYYGLNTYKDYTAIKDAGFNGTTNKNLIAPVNSINGGAGFNLAVEAPDLYNGNISSMVSSLIDINPGNTVTDNDAFPQITAYRYDQLHRIKQMKAYRNFSGNAWSSGAYDGSYETRLSYDRNGNILTHFRNGVSGSLIAAATTTMDDLTYHYEPGTNRLIGASDAATGSAYTTDIKGNATVPGSPLTYDYDYDAIGSLIKDQKEYIASIEWTVDRKVKSIKRDAAAMFAAGKNLPNLYFEYDASRQRVEKRVVPLENTSPYNEKTKNFWTTTYYVRDATGNVMAVYDQKIVNLFGYFYNIQALEFGVYGSGRLGHDQKDIQTAFGSGILRPSLGSGNYNAGSDAWVNTTLPGNYSFSKMSHWLGDGNYELSNHLGNVMAVVSDRKLMQTSGSSFSHYNPEILETHDYYPFGMEMPGRAYVGGDAYRYGMNGQEKDDELFKGANSAEYWMYDARIGRRWELDPIVKPWESPYATFNNNPIVFADPLGLDGDDKGKNGGGNNGETITKNPDGSTTSKITWERGGSCVVTTGQTQTEPNSQKVTLDAGHGDNNSKNKQADPGAVDGTHYEKDYASWIEQETYVALKFMGVDVERTRSWDKNVDPEGPINWRWKMANNNGSDIFISFHLNSGNDDKAFAVYQQGKSNEDKSIILGTEILKNLGSYFTVDLNSPVKAANKYTRFETLGVLNNFNGGAGVLIEFGGIQSDKNRTTILNNKVDIGKKIAEGIYKYINGKLPDSTE